MKWFRKRQPRARSQKARRVLLRLERRASELRLLRRKKTPDNEFRTSVWIVLGIGNPGKQYEGTRHNVGFRIVDRLAGKFGGTYKSTKTRAVMAEARTGEVKLLLAKPTTYMNESGQAIAPLMNYFKIDPERLIVAHDDADLK